MNFIFQKSFLENDFCNKLLLILHLLWKYRSKINLPHSWTKAKSTYLTHKDVVGEDYLEPPTTTIMGGKTQHQVPPTLLILFNIFKGHF